MLLKALFLKQAKTAFMSIQMSYLWVCAVCACVCAFILEDEVRVLARLILFLLLLVYIQHHYCPFIIILAICSLMIVVWLYCGVTLCSCDNVILVFILFFICIFLNVGGFSLLDTFVLYDSTIPNWYCRFRAVIGRKQLGSALHLSNDSANKICMSDMQLGHKCLGN